MRLRDGGFVSILKSNEILSQRPRPDGTHRPAGIFIGYGPSFRKGVRLEALNILDVSPLILTLAGYSGSERHGGASTDRSACRRP